MDFTGFYWVLWSGTGLLLGFTRFYWISYGFTWFYLVLLSFT